MDTASFDPYFYIELLKDQPVSGVDLSTAKILAHLEIPYKMANLYRSSIKLRNPYPYPSSATFEDLINHLDTLPHKHVELASNAAERLRIRYRLSTNWLLSLTYAMLTNHLPLRHDEGLRLHIPSDQIQGYANKLLANLRRSTINEDFLLIEVSRNMNIEQIRKFLRDRKVEINNSLDNMPSMPRTQMEARKLFWGHAAQITRHDDPKASWQKTLDNIARIINVKPGESGAPHTGEELRLMYRDYLTVMKSAEIG